MILIVFLQLVCNTLKMGDFVDYFLVIVVIPKTFSQQIMLSNQVERKIIK
jgi:hypothetical protein